MFEKVRSLFGSGHANARELAAARNLVVRGFAESHPGMARQVNEDRVALHVPQPYRPDRATLALVADGMGGVRGGDTASELAIQMIPRLYFESADSPGRALEQAIQTTGREIYAQAQRNPHLEGMGTTCAALVVIPPYAWVAWVGDSRVYLVRGGKLAQVTEDHSVVQEMVRKGLLTQDEADHHDDRNLVTRSLGVHRKVEVEVREEPLTLRAGDGFLLCSDGLTDVLTAEDLLTAIQGVPVDIASKTLISEANRRGATDNISAIVLTLTEPASAGITDLAATREYDISKRLRQTR